MGEVEDEDPGDDEEEAKKKSKFTDLVIGAAPVEKQTFQLTVSIFVGEFAPIPDIKETNIFLKLIISENEFQEIGVKYL